MTEHIFKSVGQTLPDSGSNPREKENKSMEGDYIDDEIQEDF